MKITKELLQWLYDRKIFLSFNPPANFGNKYGWLEVGSEIKINESIRIEERVGLYAGAYIPSIGGVSYSGLCTMGSFSYSYSSLPELLRVGRYSSISSGLSFLDSHHPTDLVTSSIITFRPHNQLVADLVTPGKIAKYNWHVYGNKGFPEIGNDVWIARDVTLAMGIKIGDGAVVAANSVVTKDVPPYAVVGGNPAQILKFRFPHEVCHRLLSLRWWDYDPAILVNIGFDDPERFCNELERKRSSGEAHLYSPSIVVIDPS